MTPERWARIKEVFSSARERPEGERGAFLKQACGGDLALRESVEHLLGNETDLNSPVPGILREAVPVLAANCMLAATAWKRSWARAAWVRSTGPMIRN
jgi:hypothetical protein